MNPIQVYPTAQAARAAGNVLRAKLRTLCETAGVHGAVLELSFVYGDADNPETLTVTAERAVFANGMVKPDRAALARRIKQQENGVGNKPM